MILGCSLLWRKCSGHMIDFTNLLVQKLVKITQKNIELVVYMKTSLHYRHFDRIHGQYYFLFLHLEKNTLFRVILASFLAVDLQNLIYTQGVSYKLNFSCICPQHLQQAMRCKKPYKKSRQKCTLHF